MHHNRKSPQPVCCLGLQLLNSNISFCCVRNVVAWNSEKQESGSWTCPRQKQKVSSNTKMKHSHLWHTTLLMELHTNAHPYPWALSAQICFHVASASVYFCRCRCVNLCLSMFVSVCGCLYTLLLLQLLLLPLPSPGYCWMTMVAAPIRLLPPSTERTSKIPEKHSNAWCPLQLPCNGCHCVKQLLQAFAIAAYQNSEVPSKWFFTWCMNRKASGMSLYHSICRGPCIFRRCEWQAPSAMIVAGGSQPSNVLISLEFVKKHVRGPLIDKHWHSCKTLAKNTQIIRNMSSANKAITNSNTQKLRTTPHWSFSLVMSMTCSVCGLPTFATMSFLEHANGAQLSWN